MARRLVVLVGAATFLIAAAGPADAHRLKAKRAHDAAIAAAAAVGPVAGSPYCPALLQLGPHAHRVVCRVGLEEGIALPDMAQLDEVVDLTCAVLVRVRLRPSGKVRARVTDYLPCASET